MSGRRPKPTNLKLLTGNPGGRPLNANEPQPAVVELPVPTGLDAFGRQAWKRNAPVLIKLGLLTEADADTLALYCDAYSQWRHGSRALRGLAPTDEGYRTVAITVEKARDQMRLLATEFGMTPSSRSRLSVQKADERVDPMEELLSGRRSTG